MKLRSSLVYSLSVVPNITSVANKLSKFSCVSLLWLKGYDLGIGLDTTCMYRLVPISNSKQFLRFTLLTNWRLSKVNCLHLKRGEVQPKIFFLSFCIFRRNFFWHRCQNFCRNWKTWHGPNDVMRQCDQIGSLLLESTGHTEPRLHGLPSAKVQNQAVE